MKNWQAQYNEDAHKFVKQTEQERATKVDLIIFVDLTTITMVVEDTIPTKEEPQAFNEACNHLNPKS